MTGGNPFLVGELLWEAEARGLDPTAAAADVAAIVPRRLANAVLLRLAPAAVAALAERLSHSAMTRRWVTPHDWPDSSART